jgi:hypothetical protein
MKPGDVAVALAAAVLAVALAVPAAAKARATAARAVSEDHLRTIAHGMLSHVATYGCYPGNGGPPMEAVTTPDCRTGFPDSEAFRWGYGDPRRAGKFQTGSWGYAILPYIGEEKAFLSQDYSRAVPAFYIPARRSAVPQHTPKVLDIYPKYFQVDAGLGPWGRTDYAANDQVIRGGAGNAMRPDQVRDGLATTALAAEKAMDTRSVKVGYWYWDQPIILGGSGGTGRKGKNLMQDGNNLAAAVADNWGSPDASGVWFLLCDGHTRLLPYSTPPSVIAALISPNGRDDPGFDD